MKEASKPKPAPVKRHRPVKIPNNESSDDDDDDDVLEVENFGANSSHSGVSARRGGNAACNNQKKPLNPSGTARAFAASTASTYTATCTAVAGGMQNKRQGHPTAAAPSRSDVVNQEAVPVRAPTS
eukprot:843990-Pleurochrysis_carterae.AAC.1